MSERVPTLYAEAHICQVGHYETAIISLQELLGYTNSGTTMNLCAHVGLDKMKTAADLTTSPFSTKINRQQISRLKNRRVKTA